MIPANATQLVVDLGQRLFGPEWRGPMTRFANVNRKTLDRIAAAAEAGDEYPAARGVLAAIAERAGELVEETAPYARSASDAAP